MLTPRASDVPQPAVIYARFSPRPDANECESLAVQHEQCRAWIERNELELIGTYDDPDVSGSKALTDRPGLGEAIRVVEKHGAVLVVRDLSRLARDTRLGLSLIARIGRRHGYVASVTEGADTRTPNGEFMATMHLAWATFQRQMSALRTSERMRERQAQGDAMGGNPPFGYCRDPDNPTRLIEHDDEQDAMRQVMELQASGLSYAQIAQTMEATGPRCRGTSWSKQRVGRIIASAAAT